MGDNEMTMGKRIRTRRLEQGLSQRALARPGLSGAYISRIEAGQRRPSPRVLQALAIRLDTTAAWLETGRPEPAELLALLVLANADNPLPRQATLLARQILGRDR
jgi:transcriptional regulator with XRE-family HTH domain